jgi:curved DNA-binding protein CbpA
MWFDRASAEDLSFLSQYELWGGVPAEPVRLPGLGRYGRFQFDPRALLSPNDLTVADRREVIFLSGHFHRLDHFELLELEPTTDSKEVKRAFFRFSKRLHPDVLRGRDLGALAEPAAQVFEYTSYAYELLCDPRFCEVYARVVAARDAAFMERLEAERARQRAGGAQRGVGQLPAQATPTEDPAVVEARKEALRARLAQNQARHQSVMGAAGAEGQEEAQDAVSQAKRFYQAGVIAEQRKQWASARGHFKLAAQLSPGTPEYAAALERVRLVLAKQEATELWARAESEEGVKGKRAAAISTYEQSLTLDLDPKRALAFAVKCAAWEEPARATPWLERAASAHPFNIDVRWALAQHFEARALLDDARRLCAEILRLDPSEPRAFRLQKKLSQDR